jgi:hypothetical protein
MDNQLKERDFIDLLSSLYIRKKIFYVILIFLMVVGTVFNSYYNNEFKFTLELKTPHKSSYIEIYDYLDFVKRIESKNFDSENKFARVDNIKTDYTSYISKGASFRKIENFLFDSNSVAQLAELFMNSPNYDNSYGKIELIKKIKTSINIKTLPDQSANITVSSDNESLLIYLHSVLPSFLNDSVGNKYFEYVQGVKNTKLAELRLMKNVHFNHLKQQLIFVNEKINAIQSENSANNVALASSPGSELNMLNNEKWQISRELTLIDYPEIIINTRALPKVNISYFYMLSSDPSKQDNINSLFIFSFLFFISILFHLMVVIVIDLKEQVIIRLKS